IGHPVLVGLRIAAIHAGLVDHARPRGRELSADRGELVGRIGLQPQMVDADAAFALRDREIDARILDHPFRIVGLAHRWFGAEQTGVEADAVAEVAHPDVDVKAFHADLLLRGLGMETATGRGAREGVHADAQLALAWQQLSGRYARSPFIAPNSGRYQMKRPSWRAVTRPACASSFKWNESVAGASFNLSPIAPAGSPSGPCSTSRRK